MGKTIIEKIIQLHTKEEVSTGKIVWMDLDIRSARDFGGANVVKNYEKEYGDHPIADSKKTFFTFDLVAPAKTLKYADNQQICRDFAQKHKIKIFDVDMGIGSHVLMEEGIALPNTTVVGTDSHLNILGAIGCFGQGMGDVDITFAFKTGKTWFEVPETIKVIINGKFNYPATAKDLTLYILKNLGTEKALGKAIEFYGGAIENLSIAERITLCSMVTEMGGIIGFTSFNQKRLAELKNFIDKDIEPLRPDPDASYKEIVEINIDDLVPQVSVPFSPSNVKDISELKNIKINSGFIGSCTNGRLEDFEIASDILRGKRIKEGVRLVIVPATKRVYKELLDKGIIEILFKAGAMILNPSCGGCAEGHAGLTGKGEVQISTGNRNFAGKQGKGMTYLASPAVVASSCIAGEIISPDKL
jgi:3-isopropylmalate/(R)-2-methylmalate dehydratase large subunit